MRSSGRSAVTSVVKRLATVCALMAAATSFAQTPEEVFKEDVSPIVQARCVNCHVAGGASGNTRLVFVRSSNADHEALNLMAFEDFLASVTDGADRILDKITARISHGGGVQVAAGSEQYGDMEGFLAVLGQPEASAEIIADAALRRAIELALGKAPGAVIEAAEIATLTSLVAQWANISDLTGLEYATALVTLDLWNNDIADLAPLSELVLLEELSLAFNRRISDISALGGLTALHTLTLGSGFSDLSPLATLAGLQDTPYLRQRRSR